VNTTGGTKRDQQRCRFDGLCTAQSRWILIVTWYNITAVHTHNRNTQVCVARLIYTVVHKTRPFIYTITITAYVRFAEIQANKLM